MRQLKPLKYQLGIFGVLFKDKSKSSQSSEQTRKATNTTNKTATQVKEGESKTRILNEDVQAALEEFALGALQSGIATGSDEQNAELVALLADRATTAAADIRSSTDAIIAAEERKGRERIERLSTNLGQASGGVGAKTNSFVAGATAQAESDLTLDLAALGAKLDIQARGVETAEIQSAIQQGQALDSRIANIINALRGAETTTETSEAGQQDVELIEKINETITGLTTGKMTNRDSLVKQIAGLSGFFGSSD